MAWFLIATFEQIDLAQVYGVYRADGSGRPAHDPGMMVLLLVYAYCVGERSSRQIERRCVEDVAFRVIAGNRAPDHTTIARFRARHEQALAGLFLQALRLCARAGMVKVGTISVDGTKLSANAGLGANKRHPKLREEISKILAEAADVDAREDELFGDRRGDELPEELTEGSSRRARLERAAAELEAEEAERRSARQAAHDAKVAAREQQKQQTGTYPPGRPPTPPDPAVSSARLDASQRNVTDPDSRIVNARGQKIQGYNVQAAVGPGRLIFAATVAGSAVDQDQLQSVVEQAQENLAAIDHPDQLTTVLADGGYWNSSQIRALSDTGLQVIVPTSAPRNTDRTRAPRQGPQADRINEILNTDEGKALYRERASTVEPVFAHVKHTRGITRLARRGRAAVESEWQLIATTHNLLKLFRYQPPQTA